MYNNAIVCCKGKKIKKYVIAIRIFIEYKNKNIIILTFTYVHVLLFVKVYELFFFLHNYARTCVSALTSEQNK